MASRPISPAEPTKKYPPPIQPNAHPYSIKTTSSALLSRSNSSPHSTHHTRHHYIPSSPSRIPTGTRVRHRHSSSLSSVEGDVRDVYGVRTIPAPLPTPPPIVVASSYSPSVSLKRAHESEPSHRVWKAETIPSNATQPVVENHSSDQKYRFSRDQDSRPELYAGLPPNPKQWNTDQLTTYLETSFKSGNTTNGEKDDSGLADILGCVRARGLTGRGLLRLTDADLAGTPLSDAQRAQLLERSRTLRADVFRGRICVDSYHSHEVSDNSNKIYSQFARSSTPFYSIRDASVSVDDLRLLRNNTGEGESALPPSPGMSLHRSNSVSDASAQRYSDLARMRIHRRGRVKGLVETWERASTSGSECSGSEAESESETDPEIKSISDTQGSPGSLSDLPSTVHDEPPRNVRSSVADFIVLPQEPPLLTPPPPYTHMHSTLGAIRVEEEEPSIEELLASSSNIPLRGARAWEADFGLGETVKRIPVSASADAGGPAPYVTEPDLPHCQQDDAQRTKNDSVRSKGSGMRRSTGSRGKDTNLMSRRRVVTAIFTGSPSDDVSEHAGDKAHLEGHHRYASGANDIVCGGAPANSDLQNDPDSTLRALKESVAATRAQLEAFRLRLEKVEADTARQEAMFKHAQLSVSRHPSDVELRQRRSEANERAITETAEPPRDETFVEGSGNRDVLEGWETMSLADIARAIVARTMGWLFPYGHLGVLDESQARTDSCPGANDRYRSPAKRDSRLPMARMSCSIVLVSFAICAAVLRRMGLGRWVSRP